MANLKQNLLNTTTTTTKKKEKKKKRATPMPDGLLADLVSWWSHLP
jgi:hypothetical protein